METLWAFPQRNERGEVLMYIRSTPPADLSPQGLVEWLMIELLALERAMQEMQLELDALKETIDGP